MVQMFLRDLKKVSALWSVCFRVSALERFCYKGFLRNSSETKLFVRLREVSALEDVRFRKFPLYLFACFAELLPKGEFDLFMKILKFIIQWPSWNMMASLESQVTLVTILIFFDRSYVVLHSCKVSSSGLKWFRINNEGALSASPGLISVKKSQVG